MESQIRRNAWRNHTRTWGLGEISEEKKEKKLKNSQGLDQKKGKMDSKFVGASNPTKTPKPYDANDI